MKEKTFEELIRERIDKGDAFTPTGIIKMMQQVREATGNEFIKALEGVDLPTVATMKIMAIITKPNSIKTDL